MYEICQKSFKTKKNIELFVKKIKAVSSLNKNLSGFHFRFMKEIFSSWHPDGDMLKQCGGITEIFVKRHESFRHKEFWIVLADGNSRNISFRNAIKKKNVSHSTKVKRSFRSLISKDTLSFKQHYFSRYGDATHCPVFPEEVLTWENSHVDHHHTKFRDILRSFLDDNNLSMGDVQVVETDIDGGWRIQCPILMHKFYNFHSEQATYRILSPKGNIYIESHGEQTHKENIYTIKAGTPDEQCQQVRERYAHLEPKAYTEFNRRLKRHALNPAQWNGYLNKIITEEVLVDAQKAEDYEWWLTRLNETFQGKM